MAILKEIADVQGAPSYVVRVITDVNPLGGSVKKRTLHIPNDSLKKIQQRFVETLRVALRKRPEVCGYATGCFPRCSPVKNVFLHKDDRFFYIIDLKNAYSNTNLERMSEIISSLLDVRKEETHEFLKEHCFVPLHGLMTGSCASPDLFNIYCYYEIDIKVEQSGVLEGCSYSRYLDDLCLSSDMPFDKRKRKRIRKIITEAGFQVNHRKCHLFDIRKGPITINGVGLKKNKTIFLPRHFTRKIRGLIHKAGETYDWKLWLKVEGMMGVFKMLTRRHYNRTEKKLVSAYLEVKKKLKKLQPEPTFG